MKLRTNSEVCEDVAIRWLGGAIAELNSLLKQNGVTARETREEILGSFLFHVTAELDGCPEQGIEVDGRHYRPVLAFLDY